MKSLWQMSIMELEAMLAGLADEEHRGVLARRAQLVDEELDRRRSDR